VFNLTCLQLTSFKLDANLKLETLKEVIWKI